MTKDHVGAGQGGTAIDDQGGARYIRGGTRSKEERSVGDVTDFTETLDWAHSTHDFQGGGAALDFSFFKSCIGSLLVVQVIQITKSLKAFGTLNCSRDETIHSDTIWTPFDCQYSGDGVDSCLCC